MQARRNEVWWVIGLLGLYLLANLLFLTRYPLVHSDESWLGGLTRAMISNASPAVTEPFFDLKPRYPHAIKIIFHLMQMPMIALFGYGVFPLRLLSLLASLVALALVYRCARMDASVRFSLGMMVLVGVSAPFLTAAHMARQEILLCAMMLWLMYGLQSSGGNILPGTAVRLGCITGLSVGMHPNSFLLAVGCGLTLVCCMLLRGQLRVKPLLLYIGVTAAITAVFVGLSFLFDAQFPTHYQRYGQSEFDLDVPLQDKLGGFAVYAANLWQGVSGTYVLPDMKAPLLLVAILLPAGAFLLFKSRDVRIGVPLCMTLGTLAGTVLIGRYNQLSAVLWILPCMMMIPPLCRRWRVVCACLPAATAVLLLASLQAIAAALPYDYQDYCGQVAAYLKPETKTLGNLNTAFYFDSDTLLDVRNLAFLAENEMTFAQYVQSRGIEAILWPDEMQMIYERRPYLNALYGNPRAVPEVQAFLREHCTYIGSFVNPGYAVRVVQEIGKGYGVKVYRVNQPAASAAQP